MERDADKRYSLGFYRGDFRAKGNGLNKWYRGYMWVAIVMLLPGIARLSTAPSVMDAVMFYVISVIVWGSLISVILFAWVKIRDS